MGGLFVGLTLYFSKNLVSIYGTLFLKGDLLLFVFLISPPALPDLTARLRDLFLFLLRKENNLQILAFLINNCLHLKNSIW